MKLENRSQNAKIGQKNTPRKTGGMSWFGYLVLNQA